jgi:acyl-CoA synthetase (AMP-forming)/AMP-acid ligase II
VGTQLSGAVAVPCSDRLAPAELRYVLEHCAASALLTGATPTPGTAPAPTPVGWVSTVAECAAEGAAEPVDLPPPRPGDLAQLLYTSGTTGRPKGVGASHANLAYGAVTDPRRRPLAHSAHFLHAFPIGTNAGQTMLRTALDARPAALTLPQFTPARFARLIESCRVGTVFLVPAMAIELLNSGVLDRHDTTGVRLVGSTAAALPPAVATRLAAAFPAATVVNYYTSTEAAPAQTTMIFDPDRPDSVGQAVGGALRVADDAGRPVPPGTAGEVWLRAPHPRAYFADPAASREVFRGGWVRMGDLGRLDADGYLYLIDRQQDVIKCGAFKVSTLQVEAALHEHPAVVEAAAVGIAHPVLGAVVGAAVVGRPAPGLPELRAFLADRLAAHELPAKLIVMDRLPRNAAGKVRKRDLVDRFAGAAPPREPEQGQQQEDTPQSSEVAN